MQLLHMSCAGLCTLRCPGCTADERLCHPLAGYMSSVGRRLVSFAKQPPTGGATACLVVCKPHRHAVGAQAIKEETDVVICDTSGRLHTNANLMEELSKCKRALGARSPRLLGSGNPTIPYTVTVRCWSRARPALPCAQPCNPVAACCTATRAPRDTRLRPRRQAAAGGAARGAARLGRHDRRAPAARPLRAASPLPQWPESCASL